jgi:hypothetical protein
MRAPEEDEDLCTAADWFAKKGLRAVRFTAAELKAGKTPDFRIYYGDRHVGFCEVKSPHNDWLDDKLSKAEPFQLAGGCRRDPTFNKIAAHIEKAIKQFDAVNADRALPNILVFINWAATARFSDLYETLRGYLELVDGRRVATTLKIAEGRISAGKHRIDLYVWFDGRTDPTDFLFSGDSIFRNEICSLLGLDPANISE